MKKVFRILGIFTSSSIIAIVIYKYDYLLKALKMNLNPSAPTPSPDDKNKFPSRCIESDCPEKPEFHPLYNRMDISDKLSQELNRTDTLSLLIIKEEKIFYEKYWKDHDSCSLFNSFSMAKGIISLLVGCAIADGYLNSEDQLISAFLPEYKDNKFAKHLTFRHLLTMQSGLQWNEEYNHPFAENSEQYFIDDLEKQIKDLDFKQMPGKEYEYQSASAQLLGIALRKVIGKDLALYLSEKIWKPMNMEHSAYWSIDKKGMEKAFCCIHATSRDFAKIGMLLIQNGKWKGNQILDKEYCKRMMTPSFLNDAYCYNIWANDDHSIRYRFFYGFLGQFIIIIPEKKIIIVKTGFHKNFQVDQKMRPLQVDLMVREICRLTDFYV